MLDGRVAAVVLAMAASRGALGIGRATMKRSAVKPSRTDSRWIRTNYHGETVSLLAGPACVAGAAAAALAPGVPRRVRAAGIVGALGAGGVGLLDDLAGSGANRGLRGHLGALRRGELTTGVIKIAGLAATGVMAAHILGQRGGEALLSGAVVAGAANVVNLLDLRPGRALKVALAHAPAVMVLRGPGSQLLAGAVGAAAGLLPDDLAERTMLGDGGANALGAAIGVAAIVSYGRTGRLAHLVGIVGLTLASERVSFTHVIDTTPPLRWLDGLGRRR